jgi:hypothetical protein
MIAVAIDVPGIHGLREVTFVANDFDAALDYVSEWNEAMSNEPNSLFGKDRTYKLTGLPFFHQWIFHGIKPNLEHCLCGYIKAAKEIEAIHGNIFIPGGILLSGGM